MHQLSTINLHFQYAFITGQASGRAANLTVVVRNEEPALALNIKRSEFILCTSNVIIHFYAKPIMNNAAAAAAAAAEKADLQKSARARKKERTQIRNEQFSQKFILQPVALHLRRLVVF